MRDFIGRLAGFSDGGLMFPGPGTPASSGFTNTRSLIFTAASSQYLSATGKTGINQQKFTIALWIKRASTGTLQGMFSCGDATAANSVGLFFTTGNTLRFTATTAASVVVNLMTSATFTDTTSWRHVLIGVDTTQATANNRVKMWFDGAQLTSFSTLVNPVQNSNIANNFATTYIDGALNTAGTIGNFLEWQDRSVLLYRRPTARPDIVHHRNARDSEGLHRHIYRDIRLLFKFRIQRIHDDAWCR